MVQPSAISSLLASRALALALLSVPFMARDGLAFSHWLLISDSLSLSHSHPFTIPFSSSDHASHTCTQGSRVSLMVVAEGSGGGSAPNKSRQQD